MLIVDTYNDVLAQINRPQNGDMSIDLFNSFSRLAELAVIDWLTGQDLSAADAKLPAPWLTQKNMDWLSPFIVPVKKHVNGSLEKPSDYYRYESMQAHVSSCDGLEIKDIDLLTPAKFARRINNVTPGKSELIARMVGNKFEFNPKELDVELVYIRYPKFGVLGKKTDTVYKRIVPDPTSSTDYEWPEAVITLFIHNIVQRFNARQREAEAVQITPAANDLGR